MRAPSSRRLAVLFLAAVGFVGLPALSGCASSRPDDDWSRRDARAPVAQADTAGPARVGLSATMDIPDNPYGDTAVVDVPAAEDIASGAVPLGYYAEEEGDIDPNDITVGRYYYDDEGTTYYEDVAEDLDDYGQGADDDVYYGGYYADYYRYGDPAYYPSPYTYYRPYSTYRPYVRYGWYPTWHHRRAWAYSPYYAGYGYYDPYYGWGYDPYYSYGPGVYVSVGFGWGYGYGGAYSHGYRDGYYDGRYASAGYYGPGYYGRPRNRAYYDDYRHNRGGDDGRRSRVRGLPGTNSSPIAQSGTDPSRQPARRGLAPARLPRPSTDRGITRSTGRVTRTSPDRDVASDRPARLPRSGGVTSTGPGRTGTASPTTSRPTREAAPTRSSNPVRRTTPRTMDPSTRTDAPTRTTRPEPTRRTETPSRTTRPEPTRRTETPTRSRADERPEPRRQATPAPAPRTQRPAPRREVSRPAPEPRRQESRPAPAPRRESRPAPAPRRQESRPAPAPRRESRPAPAPRRETRSSGSRSSGSRSSGGRSRRGGNDD